MMNRGEHSNSIPIDLILEIFSRLPAKSIGRFRCVSKLWGSMLKRPYFADLFMTRSSARPRLLFFFQENNELSFFSAPQSQDPYGKLSPVVAAESHMKFSGSENSDYIFSYAAGLILFYDRWITKAVVSNICNPITAQYVILPELEKPIGNSFLGFDPIDKQFKVLSMNSGIVDNDETFNYILTLGTDKVRWRSIQCPFTHEPLNEGICINGVLYYLAQHSYTRYSYMIVCFDVRSEIFKCVEAECFPHHYGIKLINYKGKLGGIGWGFPGKIFKFHIWVLEDVEKQEWSKYVFEQIAGDCDLDIVGFTATGEIVFSMWDNPFHVFYFNPERHIHQSVEIQGFGNVSEATRVYAFVDYVEDLKFNIMKTTYAATSTSPPEHERINII